MQSDYDVRIKALFDEARTATPDEALTRRVMSSIRRQERRARLLLLAWTIAVLTFAWVFSPELAALVSTLNGLLESASEPAMTMISELGRSPATWIFVVPLATWYLYHNRHRLV